MLDFKGKLIVFSAPSGSGKTTIVRHLLHQEKFGLEFSISATSREKFPDKTLAVFVKPPDMNELIIRLKQRGEESSEKIAMRVAKAPTEMATAPQFDTIILNDDLATALKDAEILVEDFLNK